MTLDQWVAVFSASIGFAGLLLVAFQMRDATKQRASESIIKILDTNRQLLSLGFSHPQLFLIMQDAKNADPVFEQYYLQLWINQFSLTHS